MFLCSKGYITFPAGCTPSTVDAHIYIHLVGFHFHHYRVFASNVAMSAIIRSIFHPCVVTQRSSTELLVYSREVGQLVMIA